MVNKKGLIQTCNVVGNMLFSINHFKSISNVNPLLSCTSLKPL